MASNEELVRYLVSSGWINSERVKQAFLSVDRIHFMPEGAKNSAYFDSPLPIGHGQTISAPSVVAFMLEKLEIREGAKILELGTGSGYNTVLLSILAGPKGKVISFDVVPELTDSAQRNIEEWRKTSNIELISGDGSCGYEAEAPYDAITVTASMPGITDHPLIKQLKSKGRLIAPVGDKLYQDLILYSEGKYEKVLPVMFVPLIGKCGFPKE